MKKILLCGFYGAPNLGDELMLETILKKISFIKKNIEVTILLCDDSLVHDKLYKGYKYILIPKTLPEFDEIVKNYDYLIFGGGALIDDKEYNENVVTLSQILVDLSSLFLLASKNVICIGLSSNKNLKNKKYIKKLDFLIENAEYFSLRDTNSYNTLQNAGIKSLKKIDICDDILFSNSEILRFKKSKNKVLNVGIILIFNNIRIDKLEVLLKNIIDLISQISHCNYKINLIPFYDYNKFDEINYIKLKKNLLNGKVYLLKYPENLYNTLNCLNSQDIIISMRYHGSLISSILNKKTISIIDYSHRHYANKMNYINKYNKDVLNYDFNNFLNNNFNKDEIIKLANKRERPIKLKIRNRIKSSEKKLIRVLEDNI